MPPVMFLRTAQTEQRITDLENAVADIERRLNLLDGKKPDRYEESDKEWEAAAPVKAEPPVTGIDGDPKPVSKPLRPQRERGPVRAKG